MSGEGTDAARMSDFFVRDLNASISRNTERLLVKYIVKRGSSEALRYRDIFSQKDISRSEALVAFWTQTAKNHQIASFLEPDYEALGSLSPWIPSFRAKLVRAFRACQANGEFLEVTEQDLKKLFPRLDEDAQILLS